MASNWENIYSMLLQTGEPKTLYAHHGSILILSSTLIIDDAENFDVRDVEIK